jgi:hypothetical protein
MMGRKRRRAWLRARKEKRARWEEARRRAPISEEQRQLNLKIAEAVKKALAETPQTTEGT